jgi:uncharacterized membrane protein YfcA
MDPYALFLFIFLALMAEVLGTIGGFGSFLFFVPIAGFFLDFHSVLGITALFHIASNLTKITLFRKGFNKRLLLTIGIPATVFVIVGAFLSRFLNTKTLQLLLAGSLIILSLSFLFIKQLKVKPTLMNSIAGGALSGLTAGVFGSGGAIRGLTMAAFNLEKATFIATSAAIDLGVDLSRSVVYFSNGFIHKQHIYLIPILLLVSIAGTYIGKQLLNYFSESQFKTFALTMILITGVFTLVRQLY